MERLTTNLNDTIYFAKGKYPPTTICAEMETWEVRECMTRLAEYEDTGLTPEEIKKLQADRDYWKAEALKHCAKLGEIKLLMGRSNG